MTVPTATQVRKSAVELERRNAQVLNAAQVAELVRLGATIEALYGEPQDIEWCAAGLQFYIVQARPITTLPPEPVKWESPVAGAKWIRDSRPQWVTEPLSPLGTTTTVATMIAARRASFPCSKTPWFALVNGWRYIRADFRCPLGNPFPEDGAGHPRRAARWAPAGAAYLASTVGDLGLPGGTELAKLSDAELQTHVDQLLEALGWWWWELSWDAAMALVGEQLIGKLRVPNLADPVALFRGNDSLLLEAEHVFAPDC